MNGDSSINSIGLSLLRFCASNGFSIMNGYFKHRDIHKYTWYRDNLSQKSIIGFIIVSADLKSSIMDVRVKRGAELSTDHHLVVGSLKIYDSYLKENKESGGFKGLDGRNCQRVK